MEDDFLWNFGHLFFFVMFNFRDAFFLSSENMWYHMISPPSEVKTHVVHGVGIDWTFWLRIIRELQFLEFLEQQSTTASRFWWHMEYDPDKGIESTTIQHGNGKSMAFLFGRDLNMVDVPSPCESGWIYQVTTWFDNQPLGWSPWVTWISTFLSFEGIILGQNGYHVWKVFFLIFYGWF